MLIGMLAAMVMAGAAGNAGGANIAPPDEVAPELSKFVVRAGYSVTVAVEDLPGVRFLETDGKGTLFVSRPIPGDIVALVDKDGDGVFEKRTTFVSGKPTLHGMCWHDGWLWFTTSGSVHKARDTDGDLKADEVIDVIPAGQLPRDGGHWWRSILVGKDQFFTSIGDASNMSDQTDTERQKIWRFALDGSGKELWSSGLRNTEKLRFRPGTSEIWGLDHGSDWFGKNVGDTAGDQPVTDLNPPEEINHYVKGGFYGHPFLVGNRVPRIEYQGRKDIHELASKTIPPEFCVAAHWALNGFTFIDPEINTRTGVFPADHGGDLLIAAHGSWNSSTSVGYCIARVLFDAGKPYGLLKIVDCTEAGTTNTYARPVDCVQMGDGTVLFSSDQPSRVYRLRRAAPK